MLISRLAPYAVERRCAYTHVSAIPPMCEYGLETNGTPTPTPTPTPTTHTHTHTHTIYMHSHVHVHVHVHVHMHTHTYIRGRARGLWPRLPAAFPAVPSLPCPPDHTPAPPPYLQPQTPTAL